MLSKKKKVCWHRLPSLLGIWNCTVYALQTGPEGVYTSSWHTATWLVLAWKTTKKRVIAFVWPADPVVLLARYHCLVMMMSKKRWNAHSFIPVFTT